MNTIMKVIGQAVVSCVALSDRKNELEFTWVQIGRGFDSLLGQCLEYPTMFQKSEIRLGNKAQGDKQDITFAPTFVQEKMLDGREYAVLIRWNPASKDVPEILCFGSKADFDNTVEALKVRKNTFIPSPPRQEEAPKKSNFRFEVVKEVEDHTHYRVTTCGRTKVGKVKDIVLKLTHEIEADPTDMLLLGIWEKKGIDNRYARCDLPNIPAPPEMLLQTYLKKKA